MAQFGKTWWGQRFIAALEGFTDAARLQRGRGYSGDRRILDTNPYYGVHKEPRYQARLRMVPTSAPDWDRIIDRLGRNAALISKLLMYEMPDNIDAVCADAKLPLLPHSRKDFALTECSCPDYANPCKHIAGVYFRLAGRLDNDPFLLFELRGLAPEQLHKALCATPLGKALATRMVEESAEPVAAESFFTRPTVSPATPDYRSFWQGKQRLPSTIEPATPAAVPAILVKKGGDYPAFQEGDNSFIEVMEDFYLRVRKKNKEVL